MRSSDSLHSHKCLAWQLSQILGRTVAVASAQSARNACMGSIVAARRAGKNEAAKARTSTQAAASVNTTGSSGLTPNKNDRSNREAAAAPTNPMAQPAIASFAAEPNINP